MLLRRLTGASLLLALPTAALSMPTEIVVRVLSQDAKFVGDLTGGARITLRAAASGRVLAQGVTKGATGDTARIMDATGRSPIRHTPETAAFRTSVDVAVPTLVDLEVEGPLARPRSMIRVVSQRWLMPGQSVDAGDGWTVELPGLAITPAFTRSGATLAVTAKVELLCGCPIAPNSRWNSADYRVEASVWEGGRQRATVPLAFVSAPGNFGGSVALPAGKGQRLVVSARNVVTGNSGIAQLDVP
jgi:hypothetical protein